LRTVPWLTRPLALLAQDEALQFQVAQCLPHDGTAHVKDAAQFRLARQLLAGDKAAALDQVFQGVLDLHI